MSQTKVATALAGGTANECVDTIVERLDEQLGAEKPVLVMAFASTKQPLGEVASRLSAHYGDAVTVGASTAGEFTEQGDSKGTTSVIAIAGDFKVFAGMGEALGADAEKCVSAALDSIPHSADGYEHRTGILLLDPLAGNGEEATLLTAGLLGAQARLAGGAAGDDLAMKATHVSLGGKAASDALVTVAVFSKSPLGVGVCHGHEPISGPLKVTKAEGNVVHEVDGRPAWDVWAEQTRQSASQRGVDPDKLADDELGGYLLRYEAGLAAGEGYKIRAPLSRSEDGSLAFACGIPQGAIIQITESVPERQVEAAKTAARRAREQLESGEAAGAVIFDCICRNLILGEAFDDAVKGIAEELGGVPLAGFETYGEIALDVGSMSGFHNTTTVVLAFPR